MSKEKTTIFSALPDSGKGPGILVLHAWWGLNDFFKSFCERLAYEGFVTFAPDLYRGSVANTIDEAKRLRSNAGQDRMWADVRSAFDQLRKTPGLHGQNLGIIGFSMGANLALQLAAEKPEQVGSVTVFYGSRNGDYSGSHAAFLGHFAESDDWVASSGVKKLEKSLKTAGRPVTFYTYEKTRHWFFEKDRSEAYDGVAAELAWERTVEFLMNKS